MNCGISIHSLVKRETQKSTQSLTMQNNFNPLPRKEGDGQNREGSRGEGNFNPLPRKEGDYDDSRFAARA